MIPPDHVCLLFNKTRGIRERKILLDLLYGKAVLFIPSFLFAPQRKAESNSLRNGEEKIRSGSFRNGSKSVSSKLEKEQLSAFFEEQNQVSVIIQEDEVRNVILFIEKRSNVLILT